MLMPLEVVALKGILAGTDKERFCGVRLERTADGWPLAVATDAKVLAVVSWDEGGVDKAVKEKCGGREAPRPGFTAFVGREKWAALFGVLKQMARAGRGADNIGRAWALVCEEVRSELRLFETRVGDVALELPADSAGGGFPDWRGILRTVEKSFHYWSAAAPADAALPLRLNLADLDRLTRTLLDLGLDRVEFSVPYHPETGESARRLTTPVVWRAWALDYSRLKARGLIMPVTARLDESRPTPDARDPWGQAVPLPPEKRPERLAACDCGWVWSEQQKAWCHAPNCASLPPGVNYAVPGKLIGEPSPANYAAAVQGQKAPEPEADPAHVIRARPGRNTYLS